MRESINQTNKKTNFNRNKSHYSLIKNGLWLKTLPKTKERREVFTIRLQRPKSVKTSLDSAFGAITRKLLLYYKKRSIKILRDKKSLKWHESMSYKVFTWHTKRNRNRTNHKQLEEFRHSVIGNCQNLLRTGYGDSDDQKIVERRTKELDIIMCTICKTRTGSSEKVKLDI